VSACGALASNCHVQWVSGALACTGAGAGTAHRRAPSETGSAPYMQCNSCIVPYVRNYYKYKQLAVRNRWQHAAQHASCTHTINSLLDWRRRDGLVRIYMSVCEDHRLRVRVLYVCVRAAGEYYVIECTEGKKVRTTTSAG
jgi:hypothetical protein